MTYLVLEQADRLDPAALEAVGGRLVIFADGSYPAALALLARCTPAELRRLELEDLRALKREVCGVRVPGPAGPVGKNVALPGG